MEIDAIYENFVNGNISDAMKGYKELSCREQYKFMVYLVFSVGLSCGNALHVVDVLTKNNL